MRAKFFFELLVLYLFQVFFGCLYAVFFLGTFDISELDLNSTYFLYDVYTYFAVDQSLSEVLSTYFITFYNGLHAAILGSIFSSSSILVTVIVNGFLSNLALYNIARLNKLTSIRYFTMWLFCQPFILLYSIGWTKEILFFSFAAIVLHPKIGVYWRFLGAIGIVVIRPQWIIVIFAFYLFKDVVPRKLGGLLILGSLFSPLLFQFFPDVFFVTADEHISEKGSISTIDTWRYDSVLFSAIGFISVILKNVASPFVDVVTLSANGRVNFISIVSLYVVVLFVFSLVKVYRIKEEGLNRVGVLLLLSTYFIACLPFVHVRYILPLYLIFVCYSYLCSSSTPKLLHKS